MAYPAAELTSTSHAIAMAQRADAGCVDDAVA